ncbi:WYL domain protein [Streptococcus mitis]|uniref:helix-turn-helix transcriptional regulator n=1 Tax=Streptococcus mitis TaxID=28037 RepID=UPI0004D99B68|nr:WYL domain-containing protein [Streptococcus mitis]QBZ13505.1 WYL domain protein [Streptococcus mitis]
MKPQERLLTIFLRLQAGQRLSKAQLSEEFEIDNRTAQRYISNLKSFLQDQHIHNTEIKFDTSDNTYRLIGKTTFNKKDILVISKILLENRALNESELKSLLENLLSLLSIEEQKEIEAIIGSERYNYKSLTNDKDRIDTIWFLSEAIRRKQMLEIEYKAPLKDVKSHIIFPVSLYYDAHYFYLVAYHLKHEKYTTYRVDRIETLSKSHIKKPVIEHKDKYKDGEVRNQKVDAFEGRKIDVTLIYKGNAEIVLDQFPEHKILSENYDEIKVKITSQNTPGLKRWILGQGEAVTLLSPQKLIEEIQESLEKTLKNYKK